MKEPSFILLTDLIAAMMPALLPYLEKPFAFFGHSMGALLAFELARRLYRQHRLRPVHLVVSGHREPSLPDPHPPLHALPEPRFLEELYRLGGTPEMIMEDAELMRFSLPKLRADFSVCETYVYTPGPPLPCPITAIGGVQDTLTSRESLEAWRAQTSATLSLHMLPGDHFFLHSSQPLLLRLLAQVLLPPTRPTS